MTALVLALVLGQYTPQEAQQLFVEGNDAYYKQDWATAKARYEKLLEAGLGGADVLFNLGTAHLAAGELGHAVLYLERARRIAVADDVEANLAIARKQQVDQVVGEEAAVPFTWRIADAVNERVFATAFLITWWLGFAAFWWWRRAGAKVLPAVVMAVLLGAAVVLGAGVVNHAWVRSSIIEAVVTAPAVKVFEFPGTNAKVSFEVHAGLKVRIIESSGSFVRIRLPNALEGWASRDAVVEL
jgi:hypothetical protein